MLHDGDFNDWAVEDVPLSEHVVEDAEDHGKAPEETAVIHRFGRDGLGDGRRPEGEEHDEHDPGKGETVGEDAETAQGEGA